MALLGYGGIVELSRNWPEPMALAPEAINFSTSVIELGNSEYWTGDRIIFAAADGIPIDINGDGYADCPEGHGVYYGSTWNLGPARVHISSESDQYYQPSDSVAFYNTIATTGLATQGSGYIRIDALDRIVIYKSEIGAHNADANDKVLLSRVKTSNLVFTRYSSSSTYINAVNSAANSVEPLTLPSTSQKLETVIAVPAGFETISNDPDQRGWLFQADLQEWALDIDAANLDMTAIGETFGENTKALVRGAGSMQFLIDHHDSSIGQDPLAILRLVLLTQNSAKTTARFYLYKDRDDTLNQLGGTVYYLCNLLLTNSRLNTRFDSAITGSSDFVVTGEISMRLDP